MVADLGDELLVVSVGDMDDELKEIRTFKTFDEPIIKDYKNVLSFDLGIDGKSIFVPGKYYPRKLCRAYLLTREDSIFGINIADTLFLLD